MSTMELVHSARPAARRHSAAGKRTPSYNELAAPVRLAIARGRQWILSEQRRDGSWQARRRGDATLAAQYVFSRALSQENGSELAAVCQQAVAAILDQQASSGGWPLAPGGPADLSTSVQAYFALKLIGHDPRDERLHRARAEIRRLGGADAADTTTRFFLALFGQVPPDCRPPVSPQRLPCRWSGRVRPVGLRRGVRELFVRKPADWPALSDPNADLATWDRRSRNQRRTADTLIAIQALLESRTSNGHAALARAVGWLRDVRRQSKWSAEPHELIELMRLLNTARDLRAADRSLPPELHLFRRRFHGARHDACRMSGLPRRAQAARRPVVSALLRQQHADGSWGSPGGSPDRTAAALTALAGGEVAGVRTASDRGVEYLCATQRADGSWHCAGGPLVHGTSLAVVGLLAAGVAADVDAVAAAINWLVVYQQPSGAWGESAPAAPAGDYHPGPASAIQTAWALTALVAAGQATSDAARRAVEFLLDGIDEDGHWTEIGFPLRDHDSGRCYASDLQTTAASLTALSRWAIAAAADDRTNPQPVALRLVGAP